MSQQKITMALGIVAGILFLIIGYIYFTHTAETLPHYFPGYTDGLSKVHTKHGIAAVVVGLACFVFAWFKSGSQSTSSTK